MLISGFNHPPLFNWVTWCELAFQLAGILLDTQNLNVYTKSSMTRDAEAIQLLLVGSSPNYRNTLFDECMFISSQWLRQNLHCVIEKIVTFSIFFSVMQDQSLDSFTKVLQQNYGKPPTESKFMSLFQVLFPFLASFNWSCHQEDIY